MEGIKYVNLIEIGVVVIEIQGVENGELAVPVNNTLVRHTAFLAADTRPCVLMLFTKISHYFNIISFLNGFSNLFTKTETEMLISTIPYGLNKILMASNEYYFMAYCMFDCTT